MLNIITGETVTGREAYRLRPGKRGRAGGRIIIKIPICNEANNTIDCI